MDHTIPQFELEHPWRTRAIVAAALAVIELIVLLSVVLAVVSKPISHKVAGAAEKKVLAPATPKSTPEPKAKPSGPPQPKLTRRETSVLVLNGNGRTGAAAAEGSRVRALGYLIAGVGNAPRTDFTRSLIMFRPGYRPEAVRLAKDAGIRAITPLDGLKPKELLGAHLALVLGS
jgi:LytR cell envelope-related transcriptional attenuator